MTAGFWIVMVFAVGVIALCVWAHVHTAKTEKHARLERQRALEKTGPAPPRAYWKGRVDTCPHCKGMGWFKLMYLSDSPMGPFPAWDGNWEPCVKCGGEGRWAHPTKGKR